MKYTIHINQQVLSETSLDIIDSAILDFIIFLCGSKSPKIEKKRKDGWTWVDYNEILKQMPLLRIKSKGAITRRIKKIEEEDYISTRKVGRRLFVKLNVRVDQLFINMNDNSNRSRKRTESFTNMNGIVDKYEPIKINKDKDNKIKNLISNASVAGKEINDLIELFKPINPSYKQLFKNTTQRDCLERLVEDHSFEKVRATIEALPKIIEKPYAPKITTPYLLEKKLGELIAFVRQEKIIKKSKTAIQ